jgi:hypothetical protein
MSNQMTMDFRPVRVVQNHWTPVWHVKRGHLTWPEHVDQPCFASIEEAVAFARIHGAEPELFQQQPTN